MRVYTLLISVVLLAGCTKKKLLIGSWKLTEYDYVINGISYNYLDDSLSVTQDGSTNTYYHQEELEFSKKEFTIRTINTSTSEYAGTWKIKGGDLELTDYLQSYKMGMELVDSELTLINSEGRAKTYIKTE